jgi:hypothetical protein
MQNPEGLQPEPAPDRLTAADRDRYRAEYEQAAAARRALLELAAPWWRRALASLPDLQKPLRDWVAAEKTRRNRL